VVVLGLAVVGAAWYIKARSVLGGDIYRDLNASYSVGTMSSQPENGIQRSLKSKLEAISVRYGAVDSYQVGLPGISEDLELWTVGVQTQRRGVHYSEQVTCLTSDDHCTVYVTHQGSPNIKH